MLSVFQAVVLGLLQGLTELFPISSLGHSVILPSLLGWHINQNDHYFVTFLVATHLATAAVLFSFFWTDWVKIIRGLIRSFVNREVRSDDTYARMGWLLVVATVPAGILGLLLDQPLRTLFASPRIAAAFLIVNGGILFAAEHFRRSSRSLRRQTQSDTQIAKLSWTAAIGIGAAQAGALMPGISRSGASMAGGLLAGLNNENAARFSFMLATPIIAAAAALELPSLFAASARPELGAFAAGALCAGFAAFLAVRFLVKYFETNTLRVYAAYCVAAGVVASLVFMLRR